MTITDIKKYKRQKIDTYVTLEEVSRLNAICAVYGFKSTYKLLQYLIHCFLRVADPENDAIDDPLANEIIEMFTQNEEWETRTESNNTYFDELNYKQKVDQRKYRTPDDLPNPCI